MADTPATTIDINTQSPSSRRFSMRLVAVVLIGIIGVIGVATITAWTNRLYWQHRALLALGDALSALSRSPSTAVESTLVFQFDDPSFAAGVETIDVNARTYISRSSPSTLALQSVAVARANLTKSSSLSRDFEGPIIIELEGMTNTWGDHFFVALRALPKAKTVDVTPMIGQWIRFDRRSTTTLATMLTGWFNEALGSAAGTLDAQTLVARASIAQVRGGRLQGRPVMMITIRGLERSGGEDRPSTLAIWMDELQRRIVATELRASLGAATPVTVLWKAQWNTNAPPLMVQEPETALSGEQLFAPLWESIARFQTTGEPLVVPDALLVVDSDVDGLPDAQERDLGTNPYVADTDGDGLTDSEEIQVYRSNPLHTDTDSDGLVDGEEVRSWKTDPIKADTDGDGFNDGEEVRKGYNPAGAGKLR